MARLSKTTLRTVRFYEAEGLISSMSRPGGCRRKFPATELQKLQIISDLRAAGLSLQEIKALAGLKNKSSSADSATTQMSKALCQRIDELKQRMETLGRVRKELMSTVATIQRCRDCRAPDFPARCQSCDVTNHAEASRATELLWKN